MDINLLTSLSDNIRIDRNKCNACGRCVEICILDNLRLQLSPCRQACPLGMNCQGYIQDLARGQGAKGLEKIKEAIPFGRILGRICSKPCETNCSRIKYDGQPVAIRDLKRFLTDREEETLILHVREEVPQKIAIVGAGPAGLTAAYYLRLNGFQVDLFDRESEPGGLMRWAIPEFRLPREILEKEISFLSKMGISFKGNYTLGKELELTELERKYAAVILALGAQERSRLNIPGEDGEGILPVLVFLKKVRENVKPSLGNRVVIIGGGNAAVDAAQTAWRLGAQKVMLVSLENRAEMPAFPWSLEEAEEEGIQLLCGWGPLGFRFHGRKLIGISLQKCVRVFNAQGEFSPTYDDKTTMELLADTVILAIGQKINIDLIPAPLQGGERIIFDPVTFQTKNRKVFVAGDFTRGPSTVVEAMSQGKEAAISVKRFLQGDDLDYGRVNQVIYEREFAVDFSRAKPRARVAIPKILLPQRRGFSEITQTYAPEEALAEAERCLNCGVPFGLRTCWFCLPCEIECPEKALYVEIPYLLR
ncbi:MAG: FAD-dependent oxidoreductase [Thermodesulfobacteriota bacterium]